MQIEGRSVSSDAYRYGFNGKEKEESGGFGSLTHYDYGFRICNPGIGRFLSVDPMAEKYPDQSPYNYVFNNPIMFTDPDGRCPDCPDETYVTIADHVYGAKVGDVTSNGWEVIRVDNKETGYGDGYQGALYKGCYKGNTEYIYATAGTDFSSGADWKNNDKQLRGDAPQYSTSVGIAKELADKYSGVPFTGHSLGGGLASANALSVKGKAVRFNAAGLSDPTRDNLGISNNKANISAYVVQGEALSHFQGLIGLKAEGRITTLPASYFPQMLFTQADDVIRTGQRANNHRMSVVANKFNKYIK